jgi:aspartate/methionine/tyrosine aminotransferase
MISVVTERIKEITYAIRDIAVVANEVKSAGKKVYHLNIGDPVIYDFHTPDYISQASADATFAGKNFYVDSLGVMELREEISKYENKKECVNTTADDVLVVSGVTEGLFFIIAGLMEKDKELLVPGPSYPIYINYAKFFDGTAVEYFLDEEDDWEPDIDDLRSKVTDKTQAILLASPNNPTGIVYSRKKIKEIIDIAGEHNLPIISDEIYDKIIYEKEYTCPGSLTTDIPIIGMNGFSKSHLATGWRIGYIYYHDPENKLEELKNGVANLARSRLCANSIAQYAATEILKNPGTHTDEMVKKLRERRDYSYKRLRQIEGVKVNKPNGAFYLFPRINFEEFDKWDNDKDFIIDLVRKTGVCGVYGSGFGSYGKDHIRLTFLPDLETLETVYNLIEDFLK